MKREWLKAVTNEIQFALEYFQNQMHPFMYALFREIYYDSLYQCTRNIQSKIRVCVYGNVRIVCCVCVRSHISRFANQRFKSFARTENNCCQIARAPAGMHVPCSDGETCATANTIYYITCEIYLSSSAQYIYISCELSPPIYGLTYERTIFVIFYFLFCILFNFAPYHSRTCHSLCIRIACAHFIWTYQSLSIVITLHKIRRDIIITFCYT